MAITYLTNPISVLILAYQAREQMSTRKLPTTLIEAVRYFEDEDTAIEFLADIRWPNGEQTCPKCGAIGTHYYLAKQRRWKCRECRQQFSIKLDTVFGESSVKLSQWLPAVFGEL